MRCAKWSNTNQACAGIEHSRNAMNLGRLEGFFECERRQYGWHALGQHSLA
jgi:hypothetical protein